jgi:hypothetical protein
MGLCLWVGVGKCNVYRTFGMIDSRFRMFLEWGLAQGGMGHCISFFTLNLLFCLVRVCVIVGVTRFFLFHIR